MFLGKDKKLTFSIRKLQAGVASIAIAIAFLGSGLPTLVKAQEKVGSDITGSQQKMTVGVTYLSVDAEAPSRTEKSKIRQAPVSELKSVADDVVVMVYVKSDKVLPVTGEMATLLPTLFGLGTLLAVYKVGKKGRKELLAVLVIGGAVTLSAQTLAQSFEILDVRQESLAVGASLTGKNLSGYRYLGYLLYEDLDAGGDLANLVRTYLKETKEIEHTSLSTFLDGHVPNKESNDNSLNKLVREVPAITDETLPVAVPVYNTDDAHSEQIGFVPSESPTVAVPVYNTDDARSEQIGFVPSESPTVGTLSYEANDIDSPQIGTVSVESPSVELPVAELSYQDDIVTELISFGERRVDDATLALGETRVEEGEAGERRLVTRRYYIDGNLVQEVPASDSVTRPARDRIIYVGTKKDEAIVTKVPDHAPNLALATADLREEVSRNVTDIAFNEQVQEDNQLFEDERQVVTEGRVGHRTVITTTYFIDGEIVDTRTVTEERPAQDQIVRVGTLKRPDKTNLVNLVTEAERLVSQEIYTLSSDAIKLTFDTVLAEAKTVLADVRATVVSVEAAFNALEQAQNNLNGSVDKTSLSTLIQASEALVSTHVYYNETRSEDKAAFDRALVEAKEVFGQPDATQTAVNAAKSALESAKASLDGQATDKTGLRNLVEESDRVKGTDVYTQDSQEDRTAFDLSLTTAQSALNKESATQVEVDEVLTQLRAAKNKLDGVEEEKYLEFRHVTDALLYKKDGEKLVLVTGMTEVPTDKENYVLAFKNNGVKHTMPISEFVLEGDKIAAIVTYDNLTTYRDGQFQPRFKHLVEKTVTGPGIYATFDTLITAMKAEPSGTFKLGSDVYASDTASATYLDNFSGTLTSVDGKKYTIYNLKKPFVNNLSGARINNIAFKDAQVVSQADTAVLALTAKDNSRISNVDVQGQLTFRPNTQDTRYIGGLVATLMNSTIRQSTVDLHITAVDKSNGQALGGLVARMSGGTLDKNIVKGTITLTDASVLIKTNVAKIASSISSYFFPVTISNNIANVTLSHGRGAFGRGAYDQNTRENVSAEEEAQLRKEWGLTSSQSAPSQGQNTALTDYRTVSGYQVSREQAYRNTEKLLPLYDRQTIVRYGNKIPNNHNLATKTVISVTAMKGEKFVTNAFDKAVDKLFVLYDDNSSEVLRLQHVGNFKTTGVTEYILDDNLLYTSSIFTKVDDSFVSELAEKLSSVSWTDSNLNPVLKMTTTEKSKKALSDLYLDDSVAKVKANARTYVENIISQDGNEDYSSQTVRSILADKLGRNKEKIVLALAYLDKLYGVNFDAYNIKDLVTFKPSFYGQSVNTLDWLIELGSHTYDELLLDKNKDFFDKQMVKHLGATDLFNFLEKNRTIFAPSKSARDWFKSATKAFIHEENTGTLPTNVDVYHRLTTIPKFNRYLLLLLNMQEESAYVVSNSSALVFGNYGRVVDTNLYHTNKEEYKRQVAEQHDKIRQASRKWQRYNELIASIVDSRVKDQLIEKVTEVWDGYLIKDSANGTDDEIKNDKRRWADKYDSNFVAIKDFFGPAGRYFSRSKDKADAYANRTVQRIYFDGQDLLGYFGEMTLNHELVHVYDELAVLNGYHHRPGQDTESYALGLLESTTSANTPYYGFNVMYDLAKTNGQLATNATAERFKSAADLQTYTKGLMDVTYLMDGLEAEVILSKPKDDQRRFFNKLEQFTPKDEPTAKVITDALAHHVNERIRAFTDEEWATLSLNNVSDLIRYHVVSKSSLLPEKDYTRDNGTNYYFLPLYYPIYAGLSNDKGTSSGLLFRRHAFELLAEYGWEKGFIPYATDQYLNEANGQGQALSDKFIFKKIFAGAYKDYTDFKAKQYEQRLAKKDQLRDVTVTYNGKVYNITNGASLTELLQKAVEADLVKLKAGQLGFERERVKAAILTAYNELTDGFRTSIFDNSN